MENNTDVVFWLWGARMFFLFHIKIKIIIIILSQTHHSLLTPSVVGWNGLTFQFLSVDFRWTCKINSLNGSGEGHKNGMLENPQSQIHSQMMTIKLHFITSYTYILICFHPLPVCHFCSYWIGTLKNMSFSYLLFFPFHRWPQGTKWNCDFILILILLIGSIE